MSDTTKSDDKDFDWNDALKEWEGDVAPAPGEAPAPKIEPKPPSRALYQPPSQSGVRPPQNPPKVIAPPPKHPKKPAADSIFDAVNDELPTFVPSGDEGFLTAGESTRVAGVSDVLMASAVRESAGAPPEDFLRLDSDPTALLDELDRALSSLPPASVAPAPLPSEPPTELGESDVEEAFFADRSTAVPRAAASVEASLDDVLRDLDELEVPPSEPPMDAAPLVLDSVPPPSELPIEAAGLVLDSEPPASLPPPPPDALSIDASEEELDAILDSALSGEASAVTKKSPSDDAQAIREEIALPEEPAPRVSDVLIVETKAVAQQPDALVLDDLDPPRAEPTSEPVAEPVDASSATPSADRGAEAALRTVRARKARPERFPLVGRTADAARTRAAFLEALAERAQGTQRARLLGAAAELLAPLGETRDTRALYQRAHEADPNDILALHVLRRDAQSRRDFRELARFLEHELALPLRDDTKALLLTALAEVHLRHLGSAETAEKWAEKAVAIAPRALVPALLLSEAVRAQGKHAEAGAALERAASAWMDPRGRAALAVEAARAKERAGDLEGASRMFEEAAREDRDALDALLGRARTARARGDVAGAASALFGAAENCAAPLLREAFTWLAARLMHLRGGQPKIAAEWLAGFSTLLALQARAAAAEAAGEEDLHLQALDELSRVAHGTDRALAFVALSERHAAKGDLRATEEALREAARADSSLGLVRVVREILARRSGDSLGLASAVEEDVDRQKAGALAAAGKLAFGLGKGAATPEGLAREAALLARASADGEHPASADVLGLDVALERHENAAISERIEREIEAAPREQRPFRLLTAAELASPIDPEKASGALLDAHRRAVSAGEIHAVLSRAAMRAPTSNSAALWSEEASTATPERAAFAFTMAGRSREGAPDGLRDAMDLYRKAIEASPTYAPALWCLKSAARRAGDLATLRDMHERLGAIAPDPSDAAGRFVRAALLYAGEDADRAGVFLNKARAARPDDAIIRDLSLRLVPSLAPAEKADIVRASGEGAVPSVRRAALLGAAVVLEEAGHHAEAAAAYRGVLDAAEGIDPIALHGFERAEIAAGDVARVSDRRLRALAEAQGNAERVAALERLAELDLRERHDHGSAMLSLQSILELSPGHMPSLRGLERHFMEGARDEELLGIEEKIATHLRDGREVAAHARFAARLAVKQADAADAADELLLRAAGRAELDLWTARRVEAAARAAHDLPWAQRSSRAIVDLAGNPMERASFATRAAEWLPVDTASEAYASLAAAVEQAPDHPLAAEALAEHELAAKRFPQAAEALEAAARAAKSKTRAVRFWHHAALIWQDSVSNTDRALAAFDAAAAVDITYDNVFSRMADALEARGEFSRLADLVDRRLLAGADGPLLVELHTAAARLRERLGDNERARAALRSALAIEPDNLPLLRRLSNLSVTAEDWRGAAEILIRIARLTKDPAELQAVFFRLGDIYDVQMPDTRRAEAAFARALKLQPDDIESMERLAQIHRKQDQFADAARLLQRLVEIDGDPEKNRQHRFELADVLEKAGDLKGAERILETTRRAAPTDLVVLHAIAQFYERNQVGPALAMHLNRAAADFRTAIEGDLLSTSAWVGLVDVLTWRKRPDAARAVASAAAAIGIVDVELSRLLDPTGGIPGAGSAVASPDLDEIVAPALVGAATRQVFSLARECLEKSLPFDPKALRAEKIPRDHIAKARAEEIAKWFGFPSVEVFVTAAAPRVCVPVGTEPFALLIGRDLLATAEDREWIFLLTRATKIARSGMTIAVRSQPSELALVMGGLFRSYDPNWSSPILQPVALEEMTKRVQKHLPRKVRDDLYPSLLEMSGLSGFDPLRLGVAASELGDRAGLIAVGSAPAAISSHVKLAGLAATAPRTDAVRRIAATRALVSFAISDAHFLGRQRVGLDRG